MNRALPIWLLFLLALSGSAAAQTLDLTRARIPGGGGTSAGGQFTLFSTVGQAEAGPRMTGGAFYLDAGFLPSTLLSEIPTVFFPQGIVTMLEDSGPQTRAAFAVFEPGQAGEPAQPPTYQLSNNNPALFSAQPAIATDRTLAFTPATNANGTATVTAVVRVSGADVATNTFTIIVTAVNDQPSVAYATNNVFVLEDAGAQSITSFATFTAGPTDEAAQTATYTLTANNTALFSVQPAIAANGTLTFTPTANANGSATVTVIVADNGGTDNGGVDRNTNSFTITVTAVNDQPSVSYVMNTVTVLEDSGAQSISSFATFTAGPPDEAAQTASYTLAANNTALFSAQPGIAANGTLTFTPAANANGSAIVTVVVQDSGGIAGGGVDKNTNTFTIIVTAVNDQPSVAFATNNVVVPKNAGPLSVTNFATFTAGPPDEAVQTPTYTLTADNTALFADQPALAVNGTLTFTPAPATEGTATVTVIVQDGGGGANGGVDKATNTFVITVLPFAALADSYTVTEDSLLTVATSSGVLANDIGVGTRAVLVSPPAQGALTLNLDGSFTYRPATNFSGADSFTYVATNSTDTSAVTTVSLTVTPVNDAPGVAFTSGTVTVLEDSGAASLAAFAAFTAGPANESAQALAGYTVSNSSNALFVVQPAINNAGVLTFTPATNANGTASVTVVVQDDGGVSDGGVDKSTNTFTIVVTPVNDAPLVTLAGNVTVLEDAGSQTRSGFVVSFSPGPANESSQTPTHQLSNDNPALFSTAPAITPDGTLTFAAATNANGVAVVTVVTSDGGGTANGGVDRTTNTFTITLTAVNDAPSVNFSQSIVTVLEDAGPQSRSGFASFSPGPVNESAQGVVGYTVMVSNVALFSAAPAINNAGLLTFTSATNANGSATVTVVVQDNGGTADGGVDKSTNTFTIAVTAVNDAPVASNDSYTMSQGDVLTIAGLASLALGGSGVLANDTDVEGNPLTAAKLTNPANGTVTLNANGGFIYTPDTNFYGTDTFTYRANDGVLNSAPATVTIAVLARPVITPPPGKQRVFSSAALRFSATNAPDINAIRVSDPDSAALILTLTVTNGTLAVTVTNGLALPNGSTNTNTLVMAGSITTLNAALESLAYVSTTNYFGDDTLSLVAQDEGGRTNRGNGSFTILVEIPARGAALDVSLNGFNNPGLGRMVTNATAVSLDTNLVEGITYDPTNNVVKVLPVGGQDGSTNRSTVTVLARYSDGTTELVTVPVIIYQPLLTSATNQGSYNSTFGTPLFNPQTSLYEQKVSVVNNTPFDFTALRLTATNLPATVTLQNATLTNAGRVYLDYNLTILAGSNVTLKVEYFSSDLQPFSPGLKLELLNQQRASTVPTNALMTAVTASRNGYDPDRLAKNYLKFPTRLGQPYYVQYQDVAGPVWKTSPVVITGTGRIYNWIDDGPPGTDTAPGPVRFYRVVTDR